MADDPQGQQAPEGGESAVIRELREKAGRTDQATAEAEALRRELAIERSGIDTSTALGEFFAKSYTGDFADTDALKSHAQALGVPMKGTPAPTGQTPPTPDPQGAPPATPEDLGTNDRSVLSQGALPDEPLEAHPYDAGIKAADAVRSRGGTKDDEMAAFLGTITSAALKGDTRVMAVDGRPAQGAADNKLRTPPPQ